MEGKDLDRIIARFPNGEKLWKESPLFRVIVKQLSSPLNGEYQIMESLIDIVKERDELIQKLAAFQHPAPIRIEVSRDEFDKMKKKLNL